MKFTHLYHAAFVGLAASANLGAVEDSVLKPPLPLKTIAVVEFVNRTPMLGQNGFVKSIPDTLAASVKQIHDFVVVERAITQKTVVAKAMKNSGLFTEKSAVAVGRELKADIVLIGQFESSGNPPRSLKINLRAVETASGQIIESDYQEVILDDKTFVGLNNLCDRMAAKLKARFQPIPVRPPPRALSTTKYASRRWYDDRLAFALYGSGTTLVGESGKNFGLGFQTNIQVAYMVHEFKHLALSGYADLSYAKIWRAQDTDLSNVLEVYASIAGAQLGHELSRKFSVYLNLGAGLSYSLLTRGQDNAYFNSRDLIINPSAELRYKIRYGLGAGLRVGYSQILYAGSDFRSFQAGLGVVYAL